MIERRNERKEKRDKNLKFILDSRRGFTFSSEEGLYFSDRKEEK